MSATGIISRLGETVTLTRYASSVQVKVLRFDADLIAGNKINLSIDGEAITEVPFNADHDTTMTDLAAAIQALAKVSTATTPGSGSRDITITAEYAGSEMLVSGILVTAGASQATGTIISTVGGFIDGDYDEGSTTASSIKMSVQPLEGEELDLMTQGERTSKWYKGYTVTLLRTADEPNSRRADRITRADGTVFEVQTIKRWTGNLSHYDVNMTEVNDGTT